MAIVDFNSPIDQQAPQGGGNYGSRPDITKGHVMEIVGHELRTSSNGNPMVVIHVDFTEGPHKGCFNKPLWVFNVLATDGQKQRFAGWIKSVAQDNPGLVPEAALKQSSFDLSQIHGCKTGVVLELDRSGKYINGKDVCSVAFAQNYVSGPQPQRTSPPSQAQEAPTQASSEAAAASPQEDDLPF